MDIWHIDDHVEARGSNAIESWLDGLDKRALAKVHAKIVMLRQYGGELPKDILSDTDQSLIKKLRVKGRINWRRTMWRDGSG